MIAQLKQIYTRNGFPTTLLSDNGRQLCSKQFEEFLVANGIEHVTMTPYHPQGNGIVERFHGTLNSKDSGKEGKLARGGTYSTVFHQVHTLCVCGFLPFLFKHGWEPITPLQLLYKRWVQQSLGNIDLQQWVIENSEQVQNLKEKAVANYHECSRVRKEEWDGRAKQRTLQVGDLVLIWRSGMCESPGQAHSR